MPSFIPKREKNQLVLLNKLLGMQIECARDSPKGDKHQAYSAIISIHSLFFLYLLLFSVRNNYTHVKRYFFFLKCNYSILILR